MITYWPYSYITLNKVNWLSGVNLFSFKKFHSDSDQLLTPHFWTNVWIHKFLLYIWMIFPLSFLHKCECFRDGNSHDGMHTKNATILFCLVWLWDLVPTQNTKWTTIKTKLDLFVNEHLCWHGWNSYIQKTKNKSCTQKKSMKKQMNSIQQNLGQN
jgi:hypothetical protein